MTWGDVKVPPLSCCCPVCRHHSAVYWVMLGCLYSEPDLLVDLQIKLLSFSLFHVFLLIQRLCLTGNFPLIAGSLIQLLLQSVGIKWNIRIETELSRREMLLLVVSVSLLSPVLSGKNWWVLSKVRKINHYDLHTALTVGPDSTMSVSTDVVCRKTNHQISAREKWLTLVERERRGEGEECSQDLSCKPLTSELGY